VRGKKEEKYNSCRKGKRKRAFKRLFLQAMANRGGGGGKVTMRSRGDERHPEGAMEKRR